MRGHLIFGQPLAAEASHSLRILALMQTSPGPRLKNEMGARGEQYGENMIYDLKYYLTTRSRIILCEAELSYHMKQILSYPEERSLTLFIHPVSELERPVMILYCITIIF